MLTTESISRVVRSRVAAELRALRPNDERIPHASAMNAETATKSGPLALDSLEFMTLATAVASQFNLFDHDVQDSLLRYRTVGGWCDMLAKPPVAPHESITFASSGTMGTPTLHRHPLAWLDQEVSAWQTLLPNVSRVVCLCPVHHIYGFIWGLLLPAKLNVPAVDFPLENIVPGCFVPGDLIIATPPVWRMLATMGYRFNDGVIGVTSTAPMPDDIADALVANGLTTLYQIYGSSETAGVAYRKQARAPYRRLPFWQKPEGEAHANSLVRHCIDGQARLYPALDQLQWMGANQFTISGRRDAAVQVGGHNVSLTWVQTQLETNANVRAASVRTFTPESGDLRLKAFIVLKEDDEQARHNFAFWLQENLPAHARPRALRFGAALPVNAMGKPCDWALHDESTGAHA
jgi:long-chain acyl-CoA synthetase